MNAIRILIADDHKIVRTGLKTLLASEPDFQVVGEADDGKSAVREALALRPDVVIMDLMMPGCDGETASAALKEKLPGTNVLVLTSYSSSDIIARALRAGARGAVLKTTDDAELLSGIRKVAAGEEFLSKGVRRLMRCEPPTPQLTTRQQEVLQSLMKGLTNADIARLLGICEARVVEHVNAIMTKVGAANRTEAVAIALRKHLLKI